MRAFYFALTMVLMAGAARAEIAPDAALKRLVDGNERYVKGQLENCESNKARRQELVGTQKPFAVILGCSDSRVPPEIVFDQGIGDLFVVRVAGNVVSGVELDSIDYSALVLNSSVILVLGHENCGAVEAVLTNNAKAIATVASLIEPAIAPYRGKSNDLTQAVKANVRAIVSQLKRAPSLAELVKQNKLGVYGGYYNLASGKVEILE